MHESSGLPLMRCGPASNHFYQFMFRPSIRWSLTGSALEIVKYPTASFFSFVPVHNGKPWKSMVSAVAPPYAGAFKNG